MSILTADSLAAALTAACTGLEARADFYRTLLHTSVFVLGERNGRDIRLQRWRRQENNGEIIPFFSSLRLLEQAISTPTPYLRLGGRELFKISGATPLILNPFSETNKDFLPDECAMLRLDGLASVLVGGTNGKPASHLLAGMPDSLPDGLMQNLTERLDRQEHIETAYAAQTFAPDRDDPPRLVIALGTNSAIPNLLDELATIFAPLMPPSLPLDLVWLDDDLPLRDYLINETRPIYRKGFFGRIERMIAG